MKRQLTARSFQKQSSGDEPKYYFFIKKNFFTLKYISSTQEEHGIASVTILILKLERQTRDWLGPYPGMAPNLGSSL